MSTRLEVDQIIEATVGLASKEDELLCTILHKEEKYEVVLYKKQGDWYYMTVDDYREKRDDLTKEKKELIINSIAVKQEGALADAVLGADVFVGVSKAGALTEEMARSMNKNAIVFALANPVPEIMPDVAMKAGVAVIATGRSDFPNQLNNSLIFPGIFKGVLDNNIKQFDVTMFTRAALALSSHVKNPTRDMILPTMFDKELVDVIAKSVM
jgi:malate dehydrogenase (oxaloacetate-decarboxylating)